MEIVEDIPAIDGRCRYDWDSMQDGKIRLLVKGEDFTCRAKSVRTAALTYAKRRNIRVKVRMILDKEVYVQFPQVGQDELDELLTP